MGIELYDQLNCIPDIALTAGSTFIEEISIYKENGLDLLGLTGASLTICPYGKVNPDNIVVGVTGVCSAGKVTATIPDTSTVSLSGKYLQQLTVLDTEGNTFVPSQGVILISPAGGE
jgi:hypothetical protein